MGLFICTLCIQFCTSEYHIFKSNLDIILYWQTYRLKIKIIFFKSNLDTTLYFQMYKLPIIFFHVKFKHLFTLTNVQSEFRHHFVLTNIQIEKFFFFKSNLDTTLYFQMCKAPSIFFFQVRFRHLFALTNVQSGN